LRIVDVMASVSQVIDINWDPVNIEPIERTVGLPELSL
jgi:hypothetical protein